VALTDRDHDLLTLVGLCRYVSAVQIGREFFPSIDRARRRVRDLFDAGYVSVTLVTSTAPNVISLTRRGLDALRADRAAVAGRAGLAGAIRAGEVQRHLAVVDLRLFAASLADVRSTALARWSNRDGAALDAYGFRRRRLEPDGLAEFETPEGVVAVVCELDRPHADVTSLARRLGRYRAVAEEGRVDALWLLVTAGPARVAAVRDCVDRAGLGAWVRILTDQDVAARPARLPRGGDRAEGPGSRIDSGEDLQAGLGVGTPSADRDGRVDRGVDGPGGGTS
jgi:hypothetical protein